MSQNTFMILDETKKDVRCERCKHHKYVIFSFHESGVNLLHTYAHVLRDHAWPYLSLNQGLHWWGVGAGQLDRFPPACLGSYKKIGGK